MNYSIMVIPDGEFGVLWAPEVTSLAAAKSAMEAIAKTDGFAWEETRKDIAGVEYQAAFYVPPGQIQYCKAIPTGTK